MYLKQVKLNYCIEGDAGKRQGAGPKLTWGIHLKCVLRVVLYEVDNSRLIACAGFDNNDVKSALELACCTLLAMSVR